MAVYNAYTDVIGSSGDSRIMPGMQHFTDDNSEWYIYGSAGHGRFCAKQPDTALVYSVDLFDEDSIFWRDVSNKKYELKDHLGNVRVVFTDVKNKDSFSGVFELEVLSCNNYYPFGMALPLRNYESSAHRYGFNGMERDDEMKGAGNSIDFGARMYDPRLGRLLCTDRFASKYPYYSPYQFAGNSPILATDSEGDSIYIYDNNKEVGVALDLLCATQLGRAIVEYYSYSQKDHIHIASADFSASSFAPPDDEPPAFLMPSSNSAFDKVNGKIDLSKSKWVGTKYDWNLDQLSDIQGAKIDPNDNHYAIAVDEQTFARDINSPLIGSSISHIFNANILFHEFFAHIKIRTSKSTQEDDHEKIGQRVIRSDNSVLEVNNPSNYGLFWIMPNITQQVVPNAMDPKALEDYPQTTILKQLDEVDSDKIDEIEKNNENKNQTGVYTPPAK